MANIASTLRLKIEAMAAEVRRTTPLRGLAAGGGLTAHAVACYLESLRLLFKESQRSLVLAADRAEQRGHARLAAVFRDKTQEEQGHDAWASSDLAQLPAAATAGIAPVPATFGLIALQRELIADDPLCFMVYALWAEYFTVLLGDEWLSALAANGYARDQVSAIARHVDADRDHAAAGFEIMDRVWSGQPDELTLLRSIERAVDLFGQFCAEICSAARRAA